MFRLTLGHPNAEHGAIEQPDADVDMGMQQEEAIDGGAIFLLSSYMNHSCSPNLAIGVPLADTNNVFFYATKKISKGEELFWCYTGNDLPKEERRKLLRLQYKFWCKCPSCIE